MLGWLKKLLRNWLLEPEPPKPYLECLVLVKGTRQIVQFHVTSAHGVRLVGQPLGTDAQGVRLIGEEDAVSRERFWALWETLNTRKLQWEDGQQFKAPV